MCIVDLYIKQVVGTKTKLTVSFIDSSNYWLKYLTRTEFSEKILPAIQRAMLRSPENILEGMSYMFDDFKIDLSDFAKEIVPTLAKQLIVKSETTQNDAVKCLKSFLKQCSSSETVLYTVKHLFSVLNGSEGKLNVPVQKSMVLTAIANCTCNESFSSQESIQELLNSLLEFLKVEANDLTLHFAFDVLRICLKNIKMPSVKGDLFAKFQSFFKVCFYEFTN